MTEQEAFEQYWGRKESETQEFQHPDFKKCKVTWKIACEWQRSECNEELVMLRQRVKAFESLETKRMKDAVTVDDWRRIAEHMEYQWRCCSEGFNARCGELRQRVRELEAKAEMDYAIMAGDNALITGLKEELAALKQQGEPVGYVRKYALEHLKNTQAHTVIDAVPRTDDDIALYIGGYEQGKKDGWEACEACHGIFDGKESAQKHGDPVLYQCTKCGGANYACDCDSFRYCTKPLYEGRGDA